MNAFIPAPASTVNIDVAATTARIAVPARAGGAIRVFNNGTATAWIDFGSPGVTASVGVSVPIPAGAIEVFTCPDVGAAINVAAIAAGSTGKIYFTPGEGI